jgi:hypothetical protein
MQIDIDILNSFKCLFIHQILLKAKSTLHGARIKIVFVARGGEQCKGIYSLSFIIITFVSFRITLLLIEEHVIFELFLLC